MNLDIQQVLDGGVLRWKSTGKFVVRNGDALKNGKRG
jgi:hypothetical protein